MSLFGQNQSAGTLFGSGSASQTQDKPQTGAPQFSNPFSSNSAPQQSTGLFGNANANAANQGTQGGSLFGGGAQQNTPQNSGSLFGVNNNGSQNKPLGLSINTNTANNAPSTSQPSAGGLFGGSKVQGSGLFGSSQAQQNNSSGGLFGNTQQQNPSGSSIFGGGSNNNNNNNINNNQQQQQQQQQQVTGSSLFGNAQQSVGRGLFGSNVQGNQTQQGQGTGLFGGSSSLSSQQNQANLFSSTQQKSSLFGTGPTASQQAQNSQHGPSLFGTNSTSFPQLSLGQTTTQAASVPGVKIDLSNLRGTTRFNDLHEEVQKQITLVDGFLVSQIALKDQCDALMPGHGSNIATLAPDVDYVRNRVETIEHAIDNNSIEIRKMKAVVAKDAENARRNFRIVENMKLPQQLQYSSWQMLGSTRGTRSAGTVGGRVGVVDNEDMTEDATDLVGYFNSTANEMSQRLDAYKKHLAEIEAHLRTVESNLLVQGRQLNFSRKRSAEDQVGELGAVLREFENAILGVAGKVGEAREAAQEAVLEH